MVAVSEPKPDPVRVRRAQIARLASLGQRIGYLLFGLAVVAFFVGLATTFSGGLVLVIELCLHDLVRAASMGSGLGCLCLCGCWRCCCCCC